MTYSPGINAGGSALGLASEQSIYHLNNRMVELEVIPACRHYGMGLIPWSPLGGGLLGEFLIRLVGAVILVAVVRLIKKS